jgi:CheY-like chemotaxis protein
MNTPDERKFSSPGSRDTVHDVDPSRTQEGRQRQRIEAIARLAGEVAGDFNNLLCTVLGYADLLLSRLAPGRPEHEWAEEIKKSGERATTLMAQLLAICRLEVAQAPGKAPAEIPRGAETVLLAEDFPDIRTLVGVILRTLGYTVLEAGDGPEALRLAEEHAGPIHLLLSDIVMPGGMNGIQLAKRLTQSYPGVKLLFLSGHAGAVNGPEGLVTEGNFLPKPFSLEALAGKVREVLDSDRIVGFV